jgi:hypothetical protein
MTPVVGRRRVQRGVDTAPRSMRVETAATVEQDPLCAVELTRTT